MGKSSSTTIGYWYLIAYHAGLSIGPIDAFLEFRGGDKPAWQGRLVESGTISIYKPNLWGGEKDQGGIVSDVEVMFGEATQMPNAYLSETFGSQQPAWRGLTTLVFKGGKYGALNPYPQPSSYKIEKILKGWDSDACWYPEKAVIPVGSGGSVLGIDAIWDYVVSAEEADPGNTNLSAPLGGYSSGAGPFGGGLPTAGQPAAVTDWPIKTVIWVRRNVVLPPGGAATLYIYAENGCVVFANGVEIGSINRSNEQASQVEAVVAMPLPRSTPFSTETIEIHIKGFDEVTPSGGGTYLSVAISVAAVNAINPAHALYYLRTQNHLGREPTANMNDASFRAAADRLYSEGFGICVEIDPSRESVEEVERRICRLIGGSMSRSTVDGQWYLDLARGDYILDDLPILTDDDILSFSEQPTTLDGAVNSVSTKYFDPQRKEYIVTPAEEALDLIDAFGVNSQVLEFPEIPIAALGTRIALREKLAYITPKRVFDLTTTRKSYSWRPNQYFRLQTPKRGIDDMVCIVGDKQSGTLRSGAIKIQAVQDTFSLPDFGSVEVEEGVDTRPPIIPLPIENQIAFEAPYVNVCASISRTELSALPLDVGFLVAAAEDPATSQDFTLVVDIGAGYEEQADGAWCPTAVVNEAAAIEDPLPVSFTISSGVRLNEVEVGDIALWGSELCRVDALDTGALTISLGRSCADTVPMDHAAGEKLWFYGKGAAYDRSEYTDGETVSAKLLTNSWSQRLDVGSATPIGVTFNQRQARPYPPGKLRIGGSPAPTSVTATFTVAWVHRDRVLQADQLVDHEAASIGPESTQRYALQIFDADTDVLVVEKLDISGATADVTLDAARNVRLVLYSISDNGESWQKHERTFAYSTPGGSNTIVASTYVPLTWVIDGNGA